jgi:medium-chain acyl-[acyl-carrier-protein] hydrolase
MAPLVAVWQERRCVESFDIDLLGRLRPQALFSHLLNAAWNHAQGSIYGYGALAAQDMTWLLIKVQMRIRRQPRWGDDLIIETWPKWAERLYASRDFAVTSPAGEKLVSATTGWIILNKATGRPHRFDPAGDGLPWQPDRIELETDLQKAPELQDGREVARYRVRFSDIDVNRHVGSSRYLQWIIDSHSTAHLEAAELAAIDLSFLAEALPDDEVAVFSEVSGDGERCAVRRVGDGKELCRAALTWRVPA